MFNNTDGSGIFKKAAVGDEPTAYAYRDLGNGSDHPGWYIASQFQQDIRHQLKRKDSRIRITSVNHRWVKHGCAGR